jgi:hypothetical protein
MPDFEAPPEPWRSFFADVDARLIEEVRLHCHYEERLVPMFPGAWVHLRLFALEAHDLALTKLERNWDRDRNDVQQLARAGHLNPEILRERYYRELRPNFRARRPARSDTKAVARSLLVTN